MEREGEKARRAEPKVNAADVMVACVCYLVLQREMFRSIIVCAGECNKLQSSKCCIAPATAIVFEKKREMRALSSVLAFN